MTETLSARTELEAELGAGLTALYLLSEEHCADLLALVRAAPRRDLELAEAALAENIAGLPRGTRKIVRTVLLRGRR